MSELVIWVGKIEMNVGNITLSILKFISLSISCFIFYFFDQRYSQCHIILNFK
jgi:hypothetical protein